MKYASIKRVAIFLPTTNPFYLSMFYSLKRAFNEINVEVNGWTELLGEKDLLEFVRQFNPDVILEMNRSRQQVPFLPKTVKHISWMVDVADSPYEKISDSEIIYFFGANWFNNYPKDSKSFVDWLPPGTCPQTYYYQEHASVSDFSFVGHIPYPWSQSDLERVVYKDRKKTIKFGDLYDACLQRWKITNLRNYDNEAYFQSALSIVSEMTGEKFCVMDQKLRYDISCRSVRLMNRQKLINLVVKASKSLRIFGPNYWLKYPQFKNYYKNILDNANDIRRVYQTTRINLHEGVGLHFRTFDCMASGGLFFFFQGLDDDDFGGINRFFEPGKHYIPFTEKDFTEKTTQYIQDFDGSRRIGRQASQLVHEKHTWKQRALKILADLNEI